MKKLLYITIFCFSSIAGADVSIGDRVSIASGTMSGIVLSIDKGDAEVLFDTGNTNVIPIKFLDDQINADDSDWVGKTVSIGNGQMTGIVKAEYSNGEVLVDFGFLKKAISISHLDR